MTDCYEDDEDDAENDPANYGVVYRAKHEYTKAHMGLLACS